MKTNGVIIFGYPGIGKSSISDKDSGFIDLESSSFSVNGLKPDNWATMYANVAIKLALDGYNVFVSTHPEVIDAIATNYSDVAAIFPSIKLKDYWLEKLRTRIGDSETAEEREKNQRAYDHVSVWFEHDINELMKTCQKHFMPACPLHHELYKLCDIANHIVWSFRYL